MIKGIQKISKKEEADELLKQAKKFVEEAAKYLEAREYLGLAEK